MIELRWTRTEAGRNKRSVRDWLENADTNIDINISANIDANLNIENRTTQDDVWEWKDCLVYSSGCIHVGNDTAR